MKKRMSPAAVMALCPAAGRLVALEGSVCSFCGEQVADPVHGDERHRTTFSRAEMDALLPAGRRSLIPAGDDFVEDVGDDAPEM